MTPFLYSHRNIRRSAACVSRPENAADLIKLCESLRVAKNPMSKPSAALIKRLGLLLFLRFGCLVWAASPRPPRLFTGPTPRNTSDARSRLLESPNGRDMVTGEAVLRVSWRDHRGVDIGKLDD